MKLFKIKAIILFTTVFVMLWGTITTAAAQESQTVQKTSSGQKIQPGGELISGGTQSFAELLKTFQEIAPGVKYYTLAGKNWGDQPLRVYMLEIDPAQSKLELRVAIGKDTLGGKDTVSEMAYRHEAIAAINGGFFDPSSGWVIGCLAQDGQLLATSDLLRTSIGFSEQNKPVFGYFSPRIRIQWGEENFLDIKNINCSAPENDITLYTSAWGSNLQAPSDGLLIDVAPNQNGDQAVVSQTTTGNVQIPLNGFTLCLRGDKTSLGADLGAGTPVKLINNYGQQWEDLKHLVTAGPLLVEDGQPVLQGIAEGFRGSILETTARTAVGVNKAGHILLVVVDGKKQNWSAGLTLEELAYLMTDLGAIRAAALDGGGSSGMWIKGEMVSKPSDGKERQVANAILVIRSQLPVYVNGRRLFFDVPPVIEKGRTLVPMRRIFEALQAEVSWDEKTKTVTAVKEDKKIVLTAGKQKAMIDGKACLLDVPAKVMEGRTMVPLRFISESLGLQVTWQNKPQTIYLENERQE